MFFTPKKQYPIINYASLCLERLLFVQFVILAISTLSSSNFCTKPMITDTLLVKNQRIESRTTSSTVEAIYIILYTVNIWSIPISIVYLFTIFPIVKQFKLMCNIIVNLYAHTMNVDFKFEQQQWRRYIFSGGGGGQM